MYIDGRISYTKLYMILHFWRQPCRDLNARPWDPWPNTLPLGKLQLAIQNPFNDLGNTLNCCRIVATHSCGNVDFISCLSNHSFWYFVQHPYYSMRGGTRWLVKGHRLGIDDLFLYSSLVRYQLLYLGFHCAISVHDRRGRPRVSLVVVGRGWGLIIQYKSID